MLILNPRSVTFGDAAWESVSSIAIDRLPQRLVEEWSDDGPHPVFADVPEQRTRVTVIQELAGGDLAAPRPGDQAALSFCSSPTASDAGRKRLSAIAVVLQVRHEVSLTKGTLRTITLAAVSTDGATDPIAIADSE